MKKTDESCSNLRFADIFLRVISILLSIATVCLIVTNKQDVDSLYGKKLLFSNLIGLKYMVCISAICVGYGCLAAVCLWVRCLIVSHMIARIFFVSDQMIAYLMVTSAASLVEFIYLAYNGDQNVIWSESCSIYGYFCKRLKLAMSLHVISLCCFCLLAMISAYRLFSRFDPPFVPPDQRTDIEPN